MRLMLVQQNFLFSRLVFKLELELAHCTSSGARSPRRVGKMTMSLLLAALVSDRLLQPVECSLSACAVEDILRLSEQLIKPPQL